MHAVFDAFHYRFFYLFLRPARNISIITKVGLKVFIVLGRIVKLMLPVFIDIKIPRFEFKGFMVKLFRISIRRKPH
ncbi:hypothetical protein D3C80_1471240 [compost metagenome]